MLWWKDKFPANSIAQCNSDICGKLHTTQAYYIYTYSCGLYGIHSNTLQPHWSDKSFEMSKLLYLKPVSVRRQYKKHDNQTNAATLSNQQSCPARPNPKSCDKMPREIVLCLLKAAIVPRKCPLIKQGDTDQSHFTLRKAGQVKLVPGAVSQ